MAQNREPFLSRWSRRKRAARAAPVEPAAAPKAEAPARPATPAPELPPIDSLTPDSDFSVFMHEQVDEKLRRAALRKLFSDPALNVVDGLDDYAEDFNQLEALASGAAAGLEHAKRTLFGEAEAQAAAETEREGEGARERTGDAQVVDREAGAAAGTTDIADAADGADAVDGADPGDRAARGDTPPGDERRKRQNGA
jgi:hypothetical protein